jgi:hypothetical protein
MFTRLSLFIVLAGLSAAPPASAKAGAATAPNDAATATREARERDARRACMDGDYTTGVRLLSELFLDTKNATYIFNQGRCYEQNERYPEAISRFREYMRTTDEDKEIAQKHISECESLSRKETPPQVAPAPAPVPVATATTPLAPIPASDGAGLRLTGMVVGGFGAAALLAGVALNLKANSLTNDISPPNTYQRSTESTRKGYETASWIGYGVGAAGLVTGAVLYVVGWNRAGGTSVVPSAGPGTAGMVVERSF